MNTLHLNLIKKWFDMYDAGIKKEDYRAITPYWIKRLTPTEGNSFKKFDTVTLTNGYSPKARRIVFEFISTSVGVGNVDWGAQGESFIIKVGKKISDKNIVY